MTITVKHSKTNAISDWTQAQLDEQIALGNFAPGTTLANIVLPSDWNNDHTLTGIGTMAEQNANNVAITGGSINGTTIGATTASTGKFTSVTTPSVTASSTDLTLSAISTGKVNLNTANGTGFQVNETFLSGTSANYVYTSGRVAGSGPVLGVAGSDTNTGLFITSKGTGSITFTTNNGGTNQFIIANTASAVNYVQVTGAATTLAPVISAQGSDANIQLQVQSKGTGLVRFATGSGLQAYISDTASPVNQLVLTGGATTVAPKLSVAGTDTNISMAFQPKGTGAIDLAAGSSGVNISNGGTVTALTQTAVGAAYTSIPTITISPPTTAGGVQATATVTSMGINVANIANGGTGYAVNDEVLVSGGTFTTQARYRITSVSAGVVTGVTPIVTPNYQALPTNPASTTTAIGTGSGLTFNINWAVTGYSFTAGSGYIEQPTVTFSGGGGSGASAYANIGSVATIKGLGLGSVSKGDNIKFVGPSGVNQLELWDVGGADTWMAIQNTQYARAQFVAQGNANGQLWFSAQGTGYHNFATRGTSLITQFRIADTASAVNYLQATGSATGTPSILSTTGSDASIGMELRTKGTPSGPGFRVTNNNGANVCFAIQTSVGTPANYIQAQPGATTFPAQLAAQGADTNISVAVIPKGTGALQAQLNDGTVTGGNARGANCIDWQTYRTAATQVASGQYCTISGGASNTAASSYSVIGGGVSNAVTNFASGIAFGWNNSVNGGQSAIVGGYANSANGPFNFVGAGQGNVGTAQSVVTTQTGTANATTTLTLNASNASIKVGQLITGTYIASFTYVAAISGTTLTLSQAASGSGATTLSFYTPHGVVVGGGNNQATGAYSFIGGGGDAGTTANRNVASGDWGTIGGGFKNTSSGLLSSIVGGYGNTASGVASFVGGGGIYGNTTQTAPNTASGLASSVICGWNNTASGTASSVLGSVESQANSAYSTIVGGSYAITRSIVGNTVFSSNTPVASTRGASQTSKLIIGRQTTDATATVLASDANTPSSTNQIILPNNSAYYFKGELVAGVTGGGNTKGWSIEGVIKRGANAASTALVGTPTVTSLYGDAGASTWIVTATADTTNGGLAITVTGQAATTIRWVCSIETTEMTY